MEYDLLLLNLSRCANMQADYFRECIGQHMIAAYLAKNDFRAKVFYGDILEAETLILREINRNHIKYAGFYVTADTIVMVGNLIRHLKNTTALTILVGGPQAAALGEDFLRQTSCDFVMIGEGEKLVCKLLSCLEDGIGELEQIESLRYLDAEGVYHASSLAEPVKDLDALPYPRRQDSLHKRFRMGYSIGLITGRGCPFHCAFCYEGAASKCVRFRSIQNVMGEIDEVLSYNPSLTHVNIFDDTFTLNPDRVYAFCREIKRRGLRWTCEAHVSCLARHPEMLERMIDAGLTAMQIGIESGSRRVLEAYQKQTTPEMIEEVVLLCHRAGLQTLEGNYIIGGAFESDETLTESLQHAKRLLKLGRGMMEIQTVFFAPYYGTPITKCPERFGMQLCHDCAAHVVVTMREPVVKTENLSLPEIIAWKERFNKELQDQYDIQAGLCIKSDIVRAPLSGHPMTILGYHWKNAWGKIPHLADFIQHLTKAEQEYAPDKFPIRTGIAYPAGQKLFVGQNELTDLQASAWYYADGRCTAIQIAENLHLSQDGIAQLYFELNQKGLVYFSPY